MRPPPPPGSGAGRWRGRGPGAGSPERAALRPRVTLSKAPVNPISCLSSPVWKGGGEPGEGLAVSLRGRTSRVGFCWFVGVRCVWFRLRFPGRGAGWQPCPRRRTAAVPWPGEPRVPQRGPCHSEAACVCWRLAVHVRDGLPCWLVGCFSACSQFGSVNRWGQLAGPAKPSASALVLCLPCLETALKVQRPRSRN